MMRCARAAISFFPRSTYPLLVSTTTIVRVGFQKATTTDLTVIVALLPAKVLNILLKHAAYLWLKGRASR
jgi:hypothetical protein